VDRPWYAFYDQGVPKTITEPLLLPNELLKRNAASYPDKPFLIYKGEELSYRICNSISRRLAQGLLDLGVEKQDRITLLMPNMPQYPLTLLACYKIGAVAVPTNPQFTVYELTNQIKDSGSDTIVVAASIFCAK
jgi:long-chain acyl-CoA synthetase